MGWSSICVWPRGRVQSIAHGCGRRAGGVARSMCGAGQCSAPASGRAPRLRLDLSDPPLRSTAHAACVAIRSVVSFLHKRRMSAGRIGWDRLVNLQGRPALEPDRHTGAPWPDESDGSSLELERRSLAALILECGRRTCRLPSAGVSLQPVPAIRHITEVLDEGRPGWWRCLQMRAAPSLRLHLLVAVVAREARLRGFVPVAVSALSRWPVLASRRHCGCCDRRRDNARRRAPNVRASVRAS